MTLLLDQNIIGSIGKQHYNCEIAWNNGILVMDEPISQGGQDLGPDPYSTFLASLAGCTLATLRMYIDRKEWKVNKIVVSLNMSQSNEDGLTTTIYKKIDFEGDIDEEQKNRLLVIAEKCPVSKILTNKIQIAPMPQ